MCRTLVFAVIGIALFCVAHAQRHSPFEGEPIRFPAEQDIFFPGANELSDNSFRNNWFSIRDFRFHHPGPIPEPKRRHRQRAPKPGDPFPPPPGDFNNRKKRPRNQRRVCERKYSEYVERIFQNDTAVVDDAHDIDFDGRTLAKPGEFPHMAAVGFESATGQIEYKCGGSLISESFVITAAHCTEANGAMPKWVRIGSLNLVVEEQTLAPQVLRISRIYNHPDYNKDLYYNDIALLELEREVNLTEYVRPIRLWVHPELPTSIAFAMGYGATAFAKAVTNRLTNLNLTIVRNNDCNNELPQLSEAPDGVIDSQICAQDYILNRDTCQGDSGGPLQLSLPGRRRREKIHYHLIGITSYGVFCRSSYPSVYTRVSSFLDWIESLAWQETDS